MGMLIKGQWSYTDDDSVATTQELEKSRSYLRNWITVDGRDLSPYPGFAAEAGRYHLYYSRACPFAQRAMIFRQLKGLESLISACKPDHCNTASQALGQALIKWFRLVETILLPGYRFFSYLFRFQIL